MGNTMLIKKPNKSPVISFEDESGSEHSIKATILSHLYGEAVSQARLLTGTPEGALPRSLSIYDSFKQKIADHLAIPSATLSDETIFLVAAEMERQLDQLKKTCISTDNSVSLESTLEK